MKERNGPFCLSKNSKFLLLRVNRRIDMSFRLKIDTATIPHEIYLEHLDGILSLDSALHSRVNYSPLMTSSSMTEFVTLDGPLCKVITWFEDSKALVVTGSCLIEIDSNGITCVDSSYSGIYEYDMFNERNNEKTTTLIAVDRLGRRSFILICHSNSIVGDSILQSLEGTTNKEGYFNLFV